MRNYAQLGYFFQQKTDLIIGIFCLLWSGIVENIRTYWQTTTQYFYIPSLSLTEAKING